MNLRVTHGAGLILRRLIVRGTDCPPAVNWVEKVWHCRQSMFTGMTLSSRGLVEPWGVWQLVQPSVFTGTCS